MEHSFYFAVAIEGGVAVKGVSLGFLFLVVSSPGAFPGYETDDKLATGVKNAVCFPEHDRGRVHEAECKDDEDGAEGSAIEKLLLAPVSIYREPSFPGDGCSGSPFRSSL